MKHQGSSEPVVISKRSGYIVAGHGLAQALAKLGVEKAPVDVQAFATEADELAHMVADNELARLATADQDGLKVLIKELGDGGLDLALLGLGDVGLGALLAEPEESLMGITPDLGGAL